MKRTCMGLAAALAFVVLGSAAAFAQPGAPPPVEGKNIGSPMGTYTFSTVLNGDVQEEVEILRRLLEKSFEAVYGPLSAPTGPIFAPGMYSGMAPPMGGFGPPPSWQVDHPMPDLQGVYLKDYGVVYTVTLPPPPNKMLPGPTAGVAARTPLSPWERTRKELRGEKIEDEGKPAGGSPPLSEVILKVLADNGKHFTRLAEGEQITVVVTFRDEAANGIYHPQQPGGIGGGGAMPGMAPDGGSPSGSTKFRTASPTGVLQYAPGTEIRIPLSGSMPPSPAPESDAAWLIDVRNAIRLGDLHRRQNKYQESNVAYQDAVDKLDKGLAETFHPGMVLTRDNVPGLLTGVNLYNKLAQVFVTAGNPAAAREMLQKASSLTKKADAALTDGEVANAKPTTPALPSKLIVTASKKLMDEVGSGKMTFEAFTKAATVEYVKPAAAEKK